MQLLGYAIVILLFFVGAPLIFRFMSNKTEGFLQKHPEASRITLHSDGLWTGRYYAGVTGINGRRQYMFFIPKNAPYRHHATYRNTTYILPGQWELEFGLNIPKFCSSFWLVDIAIEPNKTYSLIFTRKTKEVVLKDVDSGETVVTHAKKNRHFRRRW